jgi:hypothetical protein
MFPICAFGLVAVPYLLTLKPKARTAQEKLSRIDWIGGALFSISGTATLVAISWGGTQVWDRFIRDIVATQTDSGLVQYAWDSAATLIPLIAGVLGLIITIAYEHRFAKHPFLEKTLFKDIGSVVTYLAAVAQGIVVR